MIKNKLFKRAIFGAVMLVAALLMSIAVGAWRNQKAIQKKPLGLITTLPMRWGEGDISNAIDMAGEPMPAYRAVQNEYDVRLIDALDSKSLKNIKLLMLAQPRAFSPTELVVFDKWVRGGGRALILADPALSLESAYPLGDKRRPLFTSLLSPLFAHWGIDLVLPMDEGSEKTIIRQVSDFDIQTITPGAWQPREGGKKSFCIISDEGFVAQCNVGKGRAILIADADMLDAELWEGTGLRKVTQDDDFANMALLKHYLRQLTGVSPN